MRIAFLYLALALVLLWLPLGLLLGRRRRRELSHPERSNLVTLPLLLRSPWAWVDLIRAGVGAWVLANRIFLPVVGPVPKTTIYLAVGLQLAALLFSVWLQVMATGSRRLRLAPLFYLLGLTVVLLPWQASLFGVALGLTLTGMLGQWRVVFWIMPVCLGAACALFRSINFVSVAVPLAYLIPALLGVRPERPLAWVFSRSRGKSARTEEPREHRHHHHSRPRPIADGRSTISVKYSAARGSFGSD